MIKRVLLAIAIPLLWASTVFGFTGPGSIWAQPKGSFTLQYYDGDTTGFGRARDACIRRGGGVITLGPGLENLPLNYPSGQGILIIKQFTSGFNTIPPISGTSGSGGGTTVFVDGITYPLTVSGVQSALNSVGFLGGGSVGVPANANIQVSTVGIKIPNRVRLFGVGTLSDSLPTFVCTSTCNVGAIIENAKIDGTQGYFGIENIQVKGSRVGGATDSVGIRLRSIFIGSAIRNTLVWNMKGDAIVCDDPGNHGFGPIVFDNVQANTLDGDGIRIDGSVGAVQSAPWMSNINIERWGIGKAAIRLIGNNSGTASFGGQLGPAYFEPSADVTADGVVIKNYANFTAGDLTFNGAGAINYPVKIEGGSTGVIFGSYGVTINNVYANNDTILFDQVNNFAVTNVNGSHLYEYKTPSKSPTIIPTLSTARLGPITGGAIRIVDGVTFPLTGAGIQAAMDEVHFAPSVNNGGKVIMPAGTIMFDSLRLWANVQLQGAAMNATELKRNSTATGTAIREKTAAQGNTSGATGIWLRDFKVNGNGTPGDGIDVGNQVAAAQLNINAGVEDVFVSGFPVGYGWIINGNSTYGKHVWSNSNYVGFFFKNGVQNNWYGIWAEGNDSIQVAVSDLGDRFFGMHLEETTVTNKGPSLDLTSTVSQGATENIFYGLDIFLAQNRTNLVMLRSGLARNSFFSMREFDYGASFSNLFYSEAFSSGTGVQKFIPFLIDGQATYPGIYRNASTNAMTQIAGADILAASKVTIADSLRVNKTTNLIGNTTISSGTLDVTAGHVTVSGGGGVTAVDSVVAQKALVTRDGALSYGVRIGDGTIGTVASNGPLKLYSKGATYGVIFETQGIQRGQFGADGHLEVGDTLRVAGRLDMNNSVILRQGVDITSAATIAIGDANFYNLTGANTVTDITGPVVPTKKIQKVTFYITGALQITNGSHWILNGNFNGNGVGGKDVLVVDWDGTNATEDHRTINP